jgi:predicted transcriptional regulator
MQKFGYTDPTPAARRAYSKKYNAKHPHLRVQSLVETIEKLLDERGWSQNELFRRSGVPQSSINRYLHGKKYPTLITLIRIADAFEITVSELLDGV